LIRVVHVGSLVLDIVLVVELLCVLLCVFVSLVLVVLIHAVCFHQLVYFAADKASEELFGKLVVDRLAFLALMVLVEFEALKSGSTSYELMRELALVIGLWIVPSPTLLVDITMRILSIVPAEHVGDLV